LLDTTHVFSEAHTVNVKGKGAMAAYYLLGRKEGPLRYRCSSQEAITQAVTPQKGGLAHASPTPTLKDDPIAAPRQFLHRRLYQPRQLPYCHTLPCHVCYTHLYPSALAILVLPTPGIPTRHHAPYPSH